MEWVHMTTIDRCHCQLADIIAIDNVMISVFKANVIAWYCGRCKNQLWQMLIAKWLITAGGISYCEVVNVIVTIGWCVWFSFLCERQMEEPWVYFNLSYS